MRRLVFAGLLLAPFAPAQVIDTSRSPKAVLHAVPVQAVRLGQGFWTERRRVNEEVSLPTLLQLFEENGILDNFRRLSGKKDVARRGPLYTDSDVYKWLEAVAFVLESGSNPALRKAAEGVIDDIVAAQEPSGYLNTYFTRENLAQRHTNMRHGHELYCLGHLLQAGIAWQRATGERKLLDAGQRMVEYLLKNFGPDKQPIFEGHPEIEMSLVELYRTTGDRRYLDFAGYFLNGDERNLTALPPRDQVYLFTGKPFPARTQLEGHAVRAMYASSGAADYYLETGDDRYWRTLDVLWDDLTRRKMYITGGVGSRSSGEAFGEPYELPNQLAYTESCAAIGVMFWNWRMAQATGDARYVDVLERALYNGANSGLSLKGNLYCYRNPLELTGNPEDRIRNAWYSTTCCPPNLQRILGSLPGYFYSTSKEGLYVHLFHNSSLKWKLEDGTPLELTQKTNYPWEGSVEVMVTPAQAKEFTLFLRLPAWAGTLKPAEGEVKNGYWALRKTWKPGDKVTLRLPVDARFVAANPRVRDDVGKVAVERGPLVYCMEALDQPQGSNVFDWFIDGTQRPRSEWRADFLGGVTAVRATGVRLSPGGDMRPLYEMAGSPRQTQAGEITLIPYYTFSNREPTSMQVWLPLK